MVLEVVEHPLCICLSIGKIYSAFAHIREMKIEVLSLYLSVDCSFFLSLSLFLSLLPLTFRAKATIFIGIRVVFSGLPLSNLVLRCLSYHTVVLQYPSSHNNTTPPRTAPPLLPPTHLLFTYLG